MTGQYGSGKKAISFKALSCTGTGGRVTWYVINGYIKTIPRSTFYNAAKSPSLFHFPPSSILANINILKTPPH